MRLIDADKLIEEINELKESPWFNEGKELLTLSYNARKEAVEVIEDLCIKQQHDREQYEKGYEDAKKKYVKIEKEQIIKALEKYKNVNPTDGKEKKQILNALESVLEKTKTFDLEHSENGYMHAIQFAIEIVKAGEKNE